MPRLREREILSTVRGRVLDGTQERQEVLPKFKFNVVLEVLKTDKSDAEVARAYEVHPVTVSRWKREFLERGAEVFGGSDEVKEYEERIGQLERMVGQKEVEIALLKNFFPRAELGRQDGAGRREPRRARAQPVPGGARRVEGHLALPDARRFEGCGEKGG